MKMPAIVTDRSARENFKDKVEVVMAVFVLSGFIYKKFQQNNESADSTNQENK